MGNISDIYDVDIFNPDLTADELIMLMEHLSTGEGIVKLFSEASDVFVLDGDTITTEEMFKQVIPLFMEAILESVESGHSCCSTEG